MKALTLLIYVLFCILLIGCDKGPQGVFKDFAKAVDKGDADKSWEYLCNDMKFELEMKAIEISKDQEVASLLGWEDVVDGKSLWKHYITYFHALNSIAERVNKEKIDGDKANLFTVIGNTELDSQVVMVREKGEWKVGKSKLLAVE